MPPRLHRPEDDAPASVWQEYLRAKGYPPETEPKPYTNYRALHGYWVPPRLGPKASAPASGGPRRKKGDVERKWYTVEALTKLYQHDRETFDVLRDRIEHVERTADTRTDAERVAEQRTILEAAVEAGLMGRQEAEQRLAAWAKEHGVAMS